MINEHVKIPYILLCLCNVVIHSNNLSIFGCIHHQQHVGCLDANNNSVTYKILQGSDERGSLDTE